MKTLITWPKLNLTKIRRNKKKNNCLKSKQKKPLRRTKTKRRSKLYIKHIKIL